MTVALMGTLEQPLEGFIKMGASIQTYNDHIIESHKLFKNCVMEMVCRVSNLHEAFHDTQEKAEVKTLAIQNLIANVKNGD